NTSNVLRGIWGGSPSNAYAVGGQSTLLHFDGSMWTVMPSPVPGVSVNDVAGSGTSVFAAGERLFELVGSTWMDRSSSSTPRDTNAVWVAAGDVQLAASSGLYHYSSGATTLAEAGAFEAVWGTGAELVAVGDDGLVAQFDGSAWTSTKIGTARLTG